MHPISYLLNQFALVFFNLINTRIDAYRILKHKTIAHGINLSCYLLFSILVYYLSAKPEISFSGFAYFDFAIYLFSAFFNRQLSFDIPLNLRRGLKWYHVSQDKPPKAWLDRQEIKIFGYNGKVSVYVYSFCWVICLIIKIIFQWQH